MVFGVLIGGNVTVPAGIHHCRPLPILLRNRRTSEKELTISSQPSTGPMNRSYQGKATEVEIRVPFPSKGGWSKSPTHTSSPARTGRGPKYQIPNTKLHRNPGIETPKTKLQTPKKSQVPSSKPRPTLRPWNLELGAWSCSGVWSFKPRCTSSPPRTVRGPR